MIRRAPLRLPRGRALLLAGSAAAALLATAGALAPSAPAPVIAQVRLADRLEPQTWAVAIPAGWLAAPLEGVRPGDVLDLIGTRTSERATASQIARGLRVMSLDDRALIVELTEDDASAIAEARARGLSLIPILRSSR